MNHKSVRAANCDVLSTDDNSHVKRVTPMDTKMKEMKSASELGIDPKREKSTARKRADKEVKPL